MPVLSQCVVAFDERRASPASNVGTLGATGDVTWTGTTRLAYTGTIYIWFPGTAGNSITCTAPATATQYEAVPLGGGSSTTGAATGGATFTFNTSGSWERVKLKNVGGDVVAEFVPVSSTATSLTDTYSVVWAINRTTTAVYKTHVVTQSVRLFNGTSDFGEVADNASLDFGASSSFTAWALIQQWGTPASSGRWMAKGQSAGVRWALASNGATLQPIFALNDGTNSGNATLASTITAGSLTIVHAVVNRTAQTSQVGYDGSTVGSTTSITAVGTLANTENVTVGKAAGGTPLYQHFALYAWGIYPGVMTATQLATLKTQLTGADTSVGPRVATLSVPAREVALSVDSREVALSVPTRTLELSA